MTELPAGGVEVLVPCGSLGAVVREDEDVRRSTNSSSTTASRSTTRSSRCGLPRLIYRPRRAKGLHVVKLRDVCRHSRPKQAYPFWVTRDFFFDVQGGMKERDKHSGQQYVRLLDVDLD